jgi:hypothetical protein
MGLVSLILAGLAPQPLARGSGQLPPIGLALRGVLQGGILAQAISA